MKKIILTGGGTAGHVTPNIALLPRLKELGYDISYIGSYEAWKRTHEQTAHSVLPVFPPENYAATSIQRTFPTHLK